MRPTYQVKAWKDDGWWLARVVATSDGADPTPLNALTQARSLAKIEEMARDLIATVLDAEEESFDIHVDYDLPEAASALLRDAAGARRWLDAAQALWQERSAAAARALTENGLSLREAAKLLGLSYQRVDQLLASGVSDEKPSGWAAIEFKRYTEGSYRHRTEVSHVHDLDVVVFSHLNGHHGDKPASADYLLRLRTRLEEILADPDAEARPSEDGAASPDLPHAEPSSPSFAPTA